MPPLYVCFLQHIPPDSWALQDGKQRVGAYEGVVKVIEPPASVFDLKMLATYFVAAATLAGAGYAAYAAYGPGASTKGKKTRAKPVAVVPAEPAVVKGSGVYNDEWIPEHHLKSRKKKADGVLSSGDESPALSGTERRRSTRKK